MDCDFSVHGILQVRILEGLPSPSLWDLPDLGTEPESPALQAGALPSEPPGKPMWALELVKSVWSKIAEILKILLISI